MTAPNPAALEKVRAFHAAHGEAWGIIEESGRERERHTGGLFERYTQADDYKRRLYDPEEIESLAVDVARWDAAGEFWTYDF
jgi:hypothetical protein